MHPHMIEPLNSSFTPWDNLNDKKNPWSINSAHMPTIEEKNHNLICFSLFGPPKGSKPKFQHKPNK